jgi:Zn-dependent peptidase ImmA (M78 family)
VNDSIVKDLSNEDPRALAERFLQQHHPSETVPVPIEEIVDLKLRIDIVPLPSLQRSFEIEGYISRDMTAIYVDEYIFLNRPNRYRFTLAHEIAHAVIHPKLFHALAFDSVEEWIDVMTGFPEKEYGWLEWQANTFAGLVLVPNHALRASFKKTVSKVEEAGLSLASMSEVARDMIIAYIAREFQVSSAVIKRRLDAEKPW